MGLRPRSYKVKLDLETWNDPALRDGAEEGGGILFSYGEKAGGIGEDVVRCQR